MEIIIINTSWAVKIKTTSESLLKRSISDNSPIKIAVVLRTIIDNDIKIPYLNGGNLTGDTDLFLISRYSPSKNIKITKSIERDKRRVVIINWI
jgi:hypothetical protein